MLDPSLEIFADEENLNIADICHQVPILQTYRGFAWNTQVEDLWD